MGACHSHSCVCIQQCPSNPSPPPPIQLPDCDFGPQLNFVGGGPFAPAEACNARGDYKGGSKGEWERYPTLCPDRVDWLVEQVAPGKALFPPVRRWVGRRRGQEECASGHAAEFCIDGIPTLCPCSRLLQDIFAAQLGTLRPRREALWKL